MWWILLIKKHLKLKYIIICRSSLRINHTLVYWNRLINIYFISTRIWMWMGKELLLLLASRCIVLRHHLLRTVVRARKLVLSLGSIKWGFIFASLFRISRGVLQNPGDFSAVSDFFARNEGAVVRSGKGDSSDNTSLPKLIVSWSFSIKTLFSSGPFRCNVWVRHCICSPRLDIPLLYFQNCDPKINGYVRFLKKHAFYVLLQSVL